jgi:hypothetical protein
MRDNSIRFRQMLGPATLLALCALAFNGLVAEQPQGTAKIETRFFRLTLSAATGNCHLLDKRTGVI